MNINQIQILVKEIQNLFFRRDYKTIISTTKEAIKKYPKTAIFYNLLGLAFSNIGKLEEARIVLEKGYQINSTDLAIINNLANVYKNSHETTRAEELYKKSIKIDKNYLNAYVNYGNLKRDLNRFSESINLYETALKLNKNIPSVNYSIAMSYQSLGDFEKSDFFAKKALEIEPKFTKADLLISRSKKYHKDDEHLKAMLEKKENTDLNNNLKADLFFAISKAYEDQEDISSSIKYLKKGNEIKRSLVNFNIELENKKFEEIKKIFNKIKEKKVDNKIINHKKIIFILGMPRSGTTLVEQIISSHSQVYSSGELPFLSLIMNKIFHEEKDIAGVLNNEKNLNKLSEQYFSFLKNYEISEQYITDKAPLNFMWIGFIKYIFPESKIIHCVRNSKDNCISLYKNIFEGSLNFSYSENELGRYYNLYKDLINFWKNYSTELFHDVHYENLINDSDYEIKKIINYCNLDWEDRCLDFSKNKNPIKTASVGQARKPIYKSSINSSTKFEPYLKDLFKLI